jgi:hypothetical protein
MARQEMIPPSLKQLWKQIPNGKTQWWSICESLRAHRHTLLPIQTAFDCTFTELMVRKQRAQAHLAWRFWIHPSTLFLSVLMKTVDVCNGRKLASTFNAGCYLFWSWNLQSGNIDLLHFLPFSKDQSYKIASVS